MDCARARYGVSTPVKSSERWGSNVLGHSKDHLVRVRPLSCSRLLKSVLIFRVVFARNSSPLSPVTPAPPPQASVPLLLNVESALDKHSLTWVCGVTLPANPSGTNSIPGRLVEPLLWPGQETLIHSSTKYWANKFLVASTLSLCVLYFGVSKIKALLKCLGECCQHHFALKHHKLLLPKAPTFHWHGSE